MMSELFRNIWMANGILAGFTVLLIQVIGIVGVVSKAFEKK